MIRRNLRALASGDPGPLLSATLTTPSWSFPGGSRTGEYRGKASIEGCFRMYLHDGLVGQAHEILVNGPPWRTTVCVLFSVQARAATEELLYDNRAAILPRARWGKIVYQEDFEDTHRISEFEASLAQSAEKA